ncbi:MAG: alpha/beta hydrolase [Ferruginibacter sp.]
MKRIVLYIIAMLFFSFITNAQEIIALYKDSIPDSKKSEKKETLNAGIIRGVVKPTLEIYLPEKEKATGTAVVICPGGSYAVLVYQGEGITMAKELAKNGIACFILKYRLPDDSIMLDKSIGPLQDAQQAIKLVRENAAKWGVDVNKIGIMGFSAGGHLATTEATHFEKAYIQNTNNTSLRPDFQVLVYPVISMQDNLTHADSRKNLLGKNPSKEIMNLFSNEMQVTKNSPPAYLTHAADDNVVDVDNSIAYFEKLRHNKVDVEMHVYPKGGHGFIFRHPGWMEPLLQWMKNNNWIK